MTSLINLTIILILVQHLENTPFNQISK